MYELANRATVNKIQVLPNESDAPATPRTPSANEYGEATDALDEGAYGDLGLVDDLDVSQMDTRTTIEAGAIAPARKQRLAGPGYQPSHAAHPSHKPATSNEMGAYIPFTWDNLNQRPPDPDVCSEALYDELLTTDDRDQLSAASDGVLDPAPEEPPGRVSPSPRGTPSPVSADNEDYVYVYGEATDALDEGAYGDLGLVDDPSCASPSIADLRLGASPSTRPADATNAPPGLAPKRGTVGN